MRSVGGAVDVLIHDSFERERLERFAVASIEFVLKLDPMQSDIVKTC